MKNNNKIIIISTILNFMTFFYFWKKFPACVDAAPPKADAP